MEYKQEQEQKDLIQKKIQELCEGIPNAYVSYLRSIGIKDNITIILKYISTMKTELNLSSNYKKDLIKLLTKFSNYCNKDFKDITRDDIISFLESFRKTETKDPLHKWIGTYNVYSVHLLRFFKWFYSPNLNQLRDPNPQ